VNRARALADAALEVPVVTSFTRLGCHLRSRLFDWTSLDDLDLSGRSIALTGPTSGIGLAAAHQLAAMGADLVLLARDRAKLDSLAGQLHATPVLVDLGDLDAVREAARQIGERGGLDALLHNAGALLPERQTTGAGHEVTVATHVLGPYLLTRLLLPTLRADGPGRVITMSSGGMYTERLTVSQLEMPPDEYRGTTAYARAKRAQVTLNEMWAEHVPHDQVVFHALHPGWADTPGVAAALPRFRRIVGPALRTPEEGADTLVWLAAAREPLGSSGRFWLDRRPRSIHRLPHTRRSDTPERRRRLWAWCEARVAG
jgi:NAD(P)-dependent dehydrogenase (short-subunit alcohol dehydrogenase family)